MSTSINSLDLSSQIVLVTGASGGIGSEICKQFRTAGAKVAGWGLSLPNEGDLNYSCDLSSDDEVSKTAAQVRKDIGNPTCIVHAGALSEHGSTMQSSPKVFADIYNVNVIGALRLVHAFVPDMQQARSGSVILISSINAEFATPSLAAYAASKGGLNTFMKTLSLELAPDRIRVNTISPASIDTPLLQSNFDLTENPEAARTANIKRHPMGRLGTPSDVAALALFLASSQAEWMTGGIFPVDGGARVTRR